MKKTMIFLMPLLGFVLFLNLSFPRSQFWCREYEVLDGDSLKCHHPEASLRLIGLDAPELSQCWDNGQPLGQWVRKQLRAKLNGQPVLVKNYGVGVYQRLLVEVRLENESINQWLVERGYAQVYPWPNHQFEQFALFQLQAQRKHLGIWSQAYSTPRNHRQKKSLVPLYCLDNIKK